MARRRANQEQLALALDPRIEMPPIYFASGTNHAGEVKGFAAVGQPMGAAVDKCNEPCLRAYEDLAEAGIPVFMDSGAFSEVEPQFRTRGSAKEFVGFRDKRPITPADWRERLDIYHRLAATLGPLLYVVAPDKVGDQQATLERLARYRDDVRHLISAGVNVIVPLQGGALSLAEFDRQVQRVLGTDRYVVGFPMKKGATSPEAIGDFVARRRPDAVHMLGLGEKNPHVERVMEIVRKASPSTKISLDSVKISSQVGWEYKQYVERMEKLGLVPMPKSDWEPSHHLVLPGFRRVKGGPVPRRLTLALHQVTPIRPYWGAQMYRRHQKDLGLEEFGVEVLDDREMVDRVDEWMDKKLRKEAMRQSGLNFYWNEYEDPYFEPQETPPPELPWLPNASMWPMPQWGKDDPAVKQFLRSPHEYMIEGYWIGPTAGLAAPDFYETGAVFLRPLYLTALGRQKLPDSKATVQSAYRKREAIKAAMGTGPEAVRFEAWEKAIRAVPTQIDWEMLGALRFWLDPYVPAGPYEHAPQDVVAAVEATAFPEFDAVRLLYWDRLPVDPWELEGKRLEAIHWKQQRGELDATQQDVDDLAKWHDSLRERFGDARTMDDYLRSVLEYRVVRYQGRPAAVPRGPELPRLAGGWRIPDFEVAEFWSRPEVVAVANPRPRGSLKKLKRKLMRR